MQFTLSEKLSNPERVQNRRPGSAVNQQTGAGDSVADGEPGAPELSSFEKILKRLDNYLEPTP